MRHRASRLNARPFTHPPRVHIPGRRRRDDGMSLIEVVVAVTLMAIIVIAVMNAVATNIRASATSRSAAQVETALLNATDRVNRAPKRCDYTIFAQASAPSGWPAQAITVSHQYYVPGPDARSTGSWAVGSPTAPGCSGAAASDLLVQRVTITIASPDGRIKRSIQVVKSDV